MPKCFNCGKGGLFQKVDKDNLCQECEVKIVLTIQTKMDGIQYLFKNLETCPINLRENYIEVALEDINELLTYSKYSFAPSIDSINNMIAQLKELKECNVTK
jgi:DNA-directed RNA polymerase subunit RPC12/RpoP